MLCIKCLNHGSQDSLIKTLGANFIDDLAIASLSLNKLLTWTTYHRNKEEWREIFIDELASQAIVQLIKKYDLNLPSARSNSSVVCYQELARFLNYTGDFDGYQSQQARLLRSFAEYVTVECNLQPCLCLHLKRKDHRGQEIEAEMQQKLDLIFLERKKSESNLLSLTVEVVYVTAKEDYNYHLSAKFSNSRNPVDTRTISTAPKLLKAAKSIQPESYDVRDMNTSEKVQTFIEVVEKELQKFTDAKYVSDVLVYTSAYVAEHEKPRFKNIVKQKEKYTIDIVLADRFIARTNLDSLRKRKAGGRISDSLPADLLIINDLHKISNRFLPYPIVRAKVERGDSEPSGKNRIHASGVYSNGEAFYLRHFSNLPLVEQPILLLPGSEDGCTATPRPSPKINHTHIIFYLWSAVSEIEGTREVFYKFGISRFDWSDTEFYSISELESAVIGRQRHYCKEHQIDASYVQLELVSVPTLISDTWIKTPAGQLEAALKNTQNNPLLARHDLSPSATESDRHPTEVMYDDRKNKMFAKPFIIELNRARNGDEAALEFLDLNATNMRYPAPK